MKLQVI